MFAKSIRKDHYGYFFIAPFFIIFLLFGLYPILYSLYISFTNWDGIRTPEFVGLGNYVAVFHDPIFYKTFLNTLFIWGVSVIPQLTVSLVLAFILNEKFVKGRNIFRAVYFFPHIVTAASLGLLVSLIFDWQSGGLNHFLVESGIIHDPINWKNNAWFMRLIVSSILFFQYFGYSMIIYLAGLQGIDPSLTEAAQIDGATKKHVFLHITVPMLKPIILFQVITSIIGGMQIFDQPFTLTNGTGAPDRASMTSIMYLYNVAFQSTRFGYGAAIAFCLFIIIILFSVLSFVLTNRKKA
ncbi:MULTISPECIES: carbohydrate ABC transporter permease [Paenibacillus]|uniref:ABC transporter n=1 Tax=Paenibacillus rhizosphaerae TaxID=297318 RepID=A0A1R1EPD1_9BACL|nr:MULTISPECIES: sugar ABC transporter permease [Paenibacillus]OMF53693.1 ABC transporter [Paenibacillus rhizosphaerae]OXL84425.1 ABC transporter [Paenibacillus sp. SSG-1]UYO02025.1 sugar ABC transporter permease [Paenibacillus sp. PSB04]